MVYKEVQPCQRLQPYIKFFWFLEGIDLHPTPERVFPDGCMEMVIHLKKSFHRLTENSQWEQPQAFIVGQITAAMHFLPSQQIAIIGVRFKPSGLAAFTNIPAHQLTNLETTIDNVWGNAAKYLTEQVCHAGIENAIPIIENFLVSQLLKNKLSASFMALQAISNSASNETTNVKNWAYLANLSERQFHRQFKNTIGISPQAYIKILRFHTIINALKTNNTITLGSLAQKFGYFDQAHFIKDFKEYTGITPTEFLANSKVLVPI